MFCESLQFDQPVIKESYSAPCQHVTSSSTSRDRRSGSFSTAVAFFREALSRYHRQHKMAIRILEKRPLGLLLVDATKMKELLTPSPQRCLEAINALLPIMARREVDRLMVESQDAEYALSTTPTATTEYVSSLTFLDEIQTRMEPLEIEADVVKEMYELIDAFRVPVPPEDIAVYQVSATECLKRNLSPTFLRTLN